MADESQREKLREVLDFWSSFDLDGRRQKMDNQCLELKEAKEAAQRSRKKLAESTKEFKKMGDAEKIVTAKDLIRAYQEEIDTLTKRARLSDGSFFSLYKDLSEAPDPVSALRSATSARPRAAATELEILKLKGEIEAYEAEFKVLKNQDISIRTLEEQLEDLEESMERKVSDQLELLKGELEVESSRKIEEVLEREAALEQRLMAAQQYIMEAERNSDRLQSKVFEVTKLGEERAAAAAAELQILAESNEKHQAAVGVLERENECLRGRLENAAVTHLDGSRGDSGDSGKVRHLEGEVSELRDDNSRLNKEVLSRDRASEIAAKAYEKNQAELTAQLKSARAELEALKSDLGGRAPVTEVEELRRQLRQLQQLEFNAMDELPEMEEHPESTSTMERMLLVRLRRVENSEMQAKRRADEATLEVDKLKTELKSTIELLDGSKNLVSKLEGDLARKGGDEPMAALLGTAEKAEVPEDMLSIVQAQRDRFMQRITELEKEKAALSRQMTTFRSTNQQLQRDNSKLYEKMRSVRSGSNMEEGVDTDLRYRSLYEQQSSPFAGMGGGLDKRMGKFSGPMSMADKITLSTTRMFLASKQARNFAFFYVLFLHLLVFITVFHWSHSAICSPLPPPKHVQTHMVGAPVQLTQVDTALTELVGSSV